MPIPQIKGLAVALLSIGLIIFYDLVFGKKKFYSPKGFLGSQLKTDITYAIVLHLGLMGFVANILSLSLPWFTGKVIGKLLKTLISSANNMFPGLVGNLVNLDVDSNLIFKLSISIIFLLTLDFLNYIQHYILHKYNFWWQIHKVHHSAESFNVFTTLREHPLDKAINFIPTFICIGIFGYPISTIKSTFWILLIAIYNSIGYIKHSNINSDWGWFGKYIIQSPIHHRAHHADIEKYYDSNFGNVFQIWDHLFNTYKDPIKTDINLRTKLGIESDQTSSVKINGNTSFIGTIIFPYISWLKIIKKSISKKVSV